MNHEGELELFILDLGPAGVNTDGMAYILLNENPTKKQ